MLATCKNAQETKTLSLTRPSQMSDPVEWPEKLSDGQLCDLVM